MSLTRIYADACGKAKEPDKVPQSPAEEAVIIQQKLDWLQNPETQKIIKANDEQAMSYVGEAIKLATSYHVHNNHQNIIQLLVRAAEILNINKQYARSK